MQPPVEKGISSPETEGQGPAASFEMQGLASSGILSFGEDNAQGLAL